MYEKLDRLRAEVERCKQKIEEDKAKLKAAENRLQEAENTQILADVGALNLTPEKLAEFLKMMASGRNGVIGNTYNGNASAKYEKDDEDLDESEDDIDEKE